MSFLHGSDYILLAHLFPACTRSPGCRWLRNPLLLRNFVVVAVACGCASSFWLCTALLQQDSLDSSRTLGVGYAASASVTYQCLRVAASCAFSSCASLRVDFLVDRCCVSQNVVPSSLFHQCFTGLLLLSQRTMKTFALYYCRRKVKAMLEMSNRNISPYRVILHVRRSSSLVFQ